MQGVDVKSMCFVLSNFSSFSHLSIFTDTSDNIQERESFQIEFNIFCKEMIMKTIYHISILLKIFVWGANLKPCKNCQWMSPK